MNRRQAFWRLFNYIQGNNEKKMKIKMTVPVTMQMAPGKTPSSLSEDNRIMSFFIPFKHQKDAPTPSADDVRLTYVEPFCAYVMVYGGWSNKWKVQRNYKALVAALKRDGLGEDFRTDAVYSAGYDGPSKIFNRHNEIWLVSKKHSPESTPQPEVETVEPSTEPPAVDSPKFCDGHDCPYFYEKELNVSDRDYTLRCYPKPYKWVSTTFEGTFLMRLHGFKLIQSGISIFLSYMRKSRLFNKGIKDIAFVTHKSRQCYVSVCGLRDIRFIGKN